MGIVVQIVAGSDEASSSVQVSGSIQHVITDAEVTTFGVGDHDLKEAVKAYFGKKPNDAYLHSPTPWGDLYKKYGWPQVQTVLVPTKAEILGITSNPTILATRVFTNNSSVEGTFNAGISEQVTNTSTSSWSTGGTLSVGQEIEYKIGFLGTGVGGKTTFSYSQSWGIGGTVSDSVTVGSEAGVSVNLQPGESVESELSASRGTMQVRITYNAYLIGSTAVNYNPRYKDHHFWGLPIDRVMSSGKILNSVKSTENIEIGYYSDAKVELKDPKGKVRSSYMMADVPAMA